MVVLWQCHLLTMHKHLCLLVVNSLKGLQDTLPVPCLQDQHSRGQLINTAKLSCIEGQLPRHQQQYEETLVWEESKRAALEVLCSCVCSDLHLSNTALHVACEQPCT